MEIRVNPRRLATDVAEKLRLHEDPAVEKSVSGRLLRQNAFVLLSPALGVIVVLDIVIAVDITARSTLDRLVAVDTLEHVHALVHRFNRDEILFRWRVRSEFPHREYETERPGAEQPREIGVPVHALR